MDGHLTTIITTTASINETENNESDVLSITNKKYIISGAVLAIIALIVIFIVCIVIAKTIDYCYDKRTMEVDQCCEIGDQYKTNLKKVRVTTIYKSGDKAWKNNSDHKYCVDEAEEARATSLERFSKAEKEFVATKPKEKCKKGKKKSGKNDMLVERGSDESDTVSCSAASDKTIISLDIDNHWRSNLLDNMESARFASLSGASIKGMNNRKNLKVSSSLVVRQGKLSSDHNTHNSSSTVVANSGALNSNYGKTTPKVHRNKLKPQHPKIVKNNLNNGVQKATPLSLRANKRFQLDKIHQGLRVATLNSTNINTKSPFVNRSTSCKETDSSCEDIDMIEDVNMKSIHPCGDHSELKSPHSINSSAETNDRQEGISLRQNYFINLQSDEKKMNYSAKDGDFFTKLKKTLNAKSSAKVSVANPDVDKQSNACHGTRKMKIKNQKKDAKDVKNSSSSKITDVVDRSVSLKKASEVGPSVDPMQAKAERRERRRMTSAMS